MIIKLLANQVADVHYKLLYEVVVVYQINYTNM